MDLINKKGVGQLHQAGAGLDGRLGGCRFAPPFWRGANRGMHRQLDRGCWVHTLQAFTGSKAARGVLLARCAAGR